MQSSIQFIDEEFGRPQAEERIKRGQMKPVASSLTAAESSAKRVLSECKTAGANMTYPADSRATPVWKAQRRTQYIGGYRTVEAAIKAARRTGASFFWDDEQLEAFDQCLDVLGENEALLLRLIPLKGG